MENDKMQQVGVKIELQFRDKTLTLEGSLEVPEEKANAPVVPSAIGLAKAFWVWLTLHEFSKGESFIYPPFEFKPNEHSRPIR